MEQHKKPTNGKLREKALREELERILPILIKGYQPQRIILFGSLAEGKVKEWSDIDLAVIKPTQKKFLDRIGEILFLIRPKLAVDVLAYTPEEYANKIKEGEYFFTEELERKGKVIITRRRKTLGFSHGDIRCLARSPWRRRSVNN